MYAQMPAANPGLVERVPMCGCIDMCFQETVPGIRRDWGFSYHLGNSCGRLRDGQIEFIR